MQIQKPELKKQEKGKPALIDDQLITELVRCGIEEPARVVEEFDLGAIGEDYDDLARPIAKKIHDRVDNYVALLENMLQPDQSIAAMQECAFFDEREMAQIIASYRRLMRTIRAYTHADIEGSHDAYARFIPEALAVWAQEKPFLLQVARKLEEGWAHDQKERPLPRSQGAYFG
jgi:hypothetical protein